MKKKITIGLIIVIAFLTLSLLLLSRNVKSYNVSFDPLNGSESFTVKTIENKKVEMPTNPTRQGYKLLGWYYINGEEEVKWNFEENVVKSDIKLTAKWEQSLLELPVINIDTQGVEINSKEEYTKMTFSMTNCEEPLVDIEGGIRLRGNSTMGYAKKPYRIKFDKKQSLFGLEKAKSWVLLAEYLDPSALLNYTALTLGNAMPGLNFTPTPHKVNVYMNGEYIGLYTLCEQVQENKGRIDIELDEITSDMVQLRDFNFFISMDSGVISDPTQVEGETYFYVQKYNKYFELKYPEKDQFVSDEQFRIFFNELQDYVLYIMDLFNEKNIEKIKQEVNINSLIDYSIIDLILGEQDHFWKSFNMYYTNTSSDEENGKLSFGPIWDYDTSLNRSFTGIPNENFEIIDKMYYSNVFIQTVFEVPEFFQNLKTRYNLYTKPALTAYINNYDQLVQSFDESLNVNHQVWYSKLSPSLTHDNVAVLKEYLVKRKSQLDELWKLE